MIQAYTDPIDYFTNEDFEPNLKQSKHLAALDELLEAFDAGERHKYILRSEWGYGEGCTTMMAMMAIWFVEKTGGSTIYVSPKHLARFFTTKVNKIRRHKLLQGGIRNEVFIKGNRQVITCNYSDIPEYHSGQETDRPHLFLVEQAAQVRKNILTRYLRKNLKYRKTPYIVVMTNNETHPFYTTELSPAATTIK